MPWRLGLALRKSPTAAPDLDELFLRMDSDRATAAPPGRPRPPSERLSAPLLGESAAAAHVAGMSRGAAQPGGCGRLLQLAVPWVGVAAAPSGPPPQARAERYVPADAG